MKEQRTGLPDWLILAFAIAMAIFTVIIVIVILYFGTASLAQVLRQHAMRDRPRLLTIEDGIKIILPRPSNG